MGLRLILDMPRPSEITEKQAITQAEVKVIWHWQMSLTRAVLQVWTMWRWPRKPTQNHNPA